MKTTPVKPKTRLTDEQFKKIKGTLEAHQYLWNEKKKLWVKNIRSIRGVAEARRKARTYVLGTDVGKIGEMYLMEDGKLTNEKKLAKKFYFGYDDPEVRKKFWKEQTGLKFHLCHY